MHIAIVGAGIAGLTAARYCQQQGHTVTVYEKNADVAGRMATRQTEFGGFDLGAQYFTALSPRFSKEVNDWLNAGWIASWGNRLVTLDHGHVQKVDDKKQRYVPVLGMSSLCKQLAHGVDVRLEQKITSLHKEGDAWHLAVECDSVAIAATAGPFDAVLLAIPPEMARLLPQKNSTISSKLNEMVSMPCWSLSLGFHDSLNLPFEGAWISNSRLAWIACDTSKPQHRAGERWVCHASGDWSVEHLEDDAQRVKEKLLKAFHQATGSPIQPMYAEVFRWRYAQAQQTNLDACWWDQNAKLGLCGDWFACGLEKQGRVENAFLSGLELAQQCLKQA